jgi:hypothetical protein
MFAFFFWQIEETKQQKDSRVLYRMATLIYGLRTIPGIGLMGSNYPFRTLNNL